MIHCRCEIHIKLLYHSADPENDSLSVTADNTDTNIMDKFSIPLFRMHSFTRQLCKYQCVCYS